MRKWRSSSTLLLVCGLFGQGAAAQPLDAPGVDALVTSNSSMAITLRSAGQAVCERGQISFSEDEDGTLTIMADGKLVEESEGGQIDRGRFHYEIEGIASPEFTLAPSKTGGWVAFSASPLQVLVFRESLDVADGWMVQAQDLLSGNVTEIAGEGASGREDAGDQRFFASLATVLAARSGTMACDPDFANCLASAQNACEPDSPQVTYLCNPQTGAVTCSWTCYDPDA